MDLKITANLNKVEVENLIKEAMQKQMPNHRVKQIVWKMTSNDDRFGSSYGYTMSGADIEMEPNSSNGYERGGQNDR